jgi:hypothetical protein
MAMGGGGYPVVMLQHGGLGDIIFAWSGRSWNLCPDLTFFSVAGRPRWIWALRSFSGQASKRCAGAWDGSTLVVEAQGRYVLLPCNTWTLGQRL